MTTTLDQVLTHARQLPPRERAQLVAQLVLELAETQLPAPQLTDEAARKVLADLRAHFAALSADVPLLSEQLERDRRERQETLEGRTNGHP